MCKPDEYVWDDAYFFNAELCMSVETERANDAESRIDLRIDSRYE